MRDLSDMAPKKYKQPFGFQPGIYFGMSNEDYHNDPALSRTGIKDILISERDFWENSNLNPNRVFKETDAMRFGTLSEMYLLEKERFLNTYNIAGGGWRQDRKTLARVEFDNIVQSAEILLGDPQMFSYFQHGYPQVSIFYRDPATGIMLRIRLDYMRTFGGIDLKRVRDITNSRLGWFCVEHGYDLQEVMYRTGIAHAKEELRAGRMKVYGEHDKIWLRSFSEDPDNEFRFVFQRSIKPYIYRVKYFDKEIRSNAKALVEEGIQKYKTAIEKYGTKEWPAGSAIAEEFSIYHFPRRTFDR